MIALERDLVRLAHQLSRRHPLRPNVEHSRDLCRDCKLNAQQTEAVLAATAPIKTRPAGRFVHRLFARASGRFW
jgi:hypothetical protein